jgi:elongation factor 1-alpha
MVLDGGYKVISFVDLAGHESYLKTTITGMTASYPDYAFVCVEKNITNTTTEHLAIVFSLDMPFAVLMTKVDIMPEAKIKSNIKRIFKMLKLAGKRAIIIKNKKDLEFFKQNPAALNIIPIILVSNVSGYGLNHVLRVLNFVEKRVVKIVPGAFVVDNVFNVVGFGIVVSGITSIDIRTGDELFLGPFSSARVGSEYIKVRVRTIHDDYRNFVDALPAGRRGCLCVRVNTVQRRALRSGMVLTRNVADVCAVRCFRARIQIFDGHATTIKPGYSAFINSGIIKSTATFTSIEGVECVRSGDSAIVNVEFLRNKYCVVPGEKFIFREGRTRGIGEII